MRIAVLIKQVPAIEEMALGPDGRLIRSGTELEMSAYCRRAVSKAVELASQRSDCSVTVYTLGPPSAEEALREAVAWGLDRDVEIDAVLITDPAFAGSDTLATARAVAAALTQDGPFDLVLCGKNSVDADTGQVPPQIAELLDLPFATAVKELRLDGEHLSLGCELDDQWLDCEITLPAVLSCAERLCEPSKVPPPNRALVPAERIRFLDAETLGPGPWGQAGSPTWVGKTRSLAVDRERYVDGGLALAEQVRRAVRVIADKGGFEYSKKPTEPKLVTSPGGPGGVVAVLAEPGRDKLLRELLGAAGLLAGEINGSTTVLLPGSMGSSSAGPAIDAEFLATYGADHIVHLARSSDRRRCCGRGLGEFGPLIGCHGRYCCLALPPDGRSLLEWPPISVPGLQATRWSSMSKMGGWWPGNQLSAANSSSRFTQVPSCSWQRYAPVCCRRRRPLNPAGGRYPRRNMSRSVPEAGFGWSPAAATMTSTSWPTLRRLLRWVKESARRTTRSLIL